LPDVQQAARQGIALAQSRLTQLADIAPEGLRPLAQKAVRQAFEADPVTLVSGKLPGLLSGVLSRIPGGALGIGTGLLAGFMLSARLPRIRAWLQPRLPRFLKEKTLPALKQVRHSLWGWIKAQSKLASLTYLIVTLGFLLLRIPYAPVWALPVALVDAVPVLGTGTVLLPWALMELLRGQTLRAVGLALTWGASVLTRTVLEPKLVGKQLGLDPLVTLVCFYFGFRLWGVAGMLLAPLLAAAAKAFTESAA
jgi:sporulation integral membrane protein YtvI